MADSRLKLLYIASSGRSGSTLLDMLLGAQPGLWTMGEVELLPHEHALGRKPCGCGAVVAKCPFWGPVVAEAEAVLRGGSIGALRNELGYGKVLRPGPARDILWGAGAGHHEGDEWGRDNRLLLDTVLAHARTLDPETTWLVDASKDPYRLLALARCGLFDLRVVHLLRDPRGFVYAKVRKGEDRAPLLQTMRMSARWVVENRLIEAVCERHLPAGATMRLHYEDLANAPAGAVADILERLGLPSDRVNLNFSGVSHGVSGNAMRLGGANEIRLDERWKTAFSPSLRVLTSLLTGLFTKRFGF